MRGLSAVTSMSELSRRCLMRLTFGSMPRAQRSFNERMASASSCPCRHGARRRRDAGWVRPHDAVNIARRPVESAHRVWEDVMAKKQADTVYKIVEVVGVSERSWEEAGRTAVETAAGTLRDLRVAEVTQMDMKVEDGKVAAFRTRVSLSFKYEA